GRHEFYRYTPKEHPSTKIFAFEGIHVDLKRSNEHQVVLRDVGFNLSGNFSCEVTTDGPRFSTVTVHKKMLVVGLERCVKLLTRVTPFPFSFKKMTLKCVARIGDFYEQDAEITFDNGKDPIPARGESRGFPLIPLG
ncbi:hypothetical protein NQ315_012585, partial [Exocentrus adspersus]